MQPILFKKKKKNLEYKRSTKDRSLLQAKRYKPVNFLKRTRCVGRKKQMTAFSLQAVECLTTNIALPSASKQREKKQTIGANRREI